MTYTEYVTFNGKKYVSLSVIEKLRERVKNIPITEERDYATYWDCRDDVLEIIDKVVKEIAQ